MRLLLFGGKNKSGGMSVKQLKQLDKRQLKYVTGRDTETYSEVRLGEAGAINVSDKELTVVCGGVNILRCDIKEVKAAELMNLSGITLKGQDLDSGEYKSIIAYYSDGYVGIAAAKN